MPINETSLVIKAYFSKALKYTKHTKFKKKIKIKYLFAFIVRFQIKFTTFDDSTSNSYLSLFFFSFFFFVSTILLAESDHPHYHDDIDDDSQSHERDHGVIGIEETVENEDNVEIEEYASVNHHKIEHHREHHESHHIRNRRSIPSHNDENSPYVMEVLVAVDRKMQEYHGNELNQYVLALMSIVS